MVHITDEAYDEALKVMHLNATDKGFTASYERKENYFAVWSRDHSICALAALCSNDDQLIATAKTGILNLLKNQIDHGQVPSYIEMENKKKVYGGLGAITSIDSNMWVAITAAVLYKRTKDKRFMSSTNIRRYQRFYRLFKAFDSNNCGLIEVPKAGDWADVFNRTYHVLYDEVLYYEALKALHFLLKEGYEVTKDETERKKIKKRIKWIHKRRIWVKRRINQVFWFTKESIPKIFEEYMIYDKIEEKEYPYYISHLMPFKMHWQWQFDTFGNILAVVTNIADDSKKKKIIKYALDSKINEPLPVKSLEPPVFKHNVGWQSIYQYKEQPYTYHNGGVWPMLGGFWIYALVKNKKKRKAKEDLIKFAEGMKQMNYNFNEHINGKTGQPLGKIQQAWSAAGYIIAYQSVKKQINLFDF